MAAATQTAHNIKPRKMFEMTSKSKQRARAGFEMWCRGWCVESAQSSSSWHWTAVYVLTTRCGKIK